MSGCKSPEPWYAALDKAERESLTCPAHGFNHYSSDCDTCLDIVERPGGARELIRHAAKAR